MNLIQEKKAVFDGFKIPWNKEIEIKFKKEKASYPNIDPQIILDRICKSYLEYAFEHETETYHAYLKEKYGNKSVLKRTIKNQIGTEGFDLLLEEKLIKKSDKEHFVIV